MKVNIIASEPQYGEHLEPIYKALDPAETSMSTAYVPAHGSSGVWLVASTKDLDRIPEAVKTKVYMEHGCGLQKHFKHRHTAFFTQNPHILAPNQFVVDMFRNSLGFEGATSIIGTPKMDELLKIQEPEGQTVAISFHWTGHHKQWAIYRRILKRLARAHKIVGHAHPRARNYLEREFKGLGVEFLPTFKDVVRRANVLACDHSSIIYEWAALDRPVVILERPGGEHMVNSSGLLYTFHRDVGLHATPGNLEEQLGVAFEHRDATVFNRMAATADLFPYLGSATNRAIEVLYNEVQHD